ncbi:MAG: ATP-binding protein [Sterolibacterium sp.]|nr:ATP-binding protein [Sterolibacterium sp.]
MNSPLSKQSALTHLFRWRSLKTKVTLYTLTIFLVGIWSLAFYASHMLRQDMQNLLGNQQFSTVSVLAAQVNQELSDRLGALEKVAKHVSPAMMKDASALQKFIEARLVFQTLFNGGAFITDIDGIALASIPLSLERKGVNYMDRDFIVSPLKEGKATIGLPVMGKKLLAPVLSIGVPIRDAQGKVIGVLTGTTNLGMPNFLDKITENRYGKSGGYFVVVPKYRLPIAASDKSRVMKPFPARGIIPTLDRFLDGDEGSAIYVNPLGVEVLGSASTVHVAGWFVGAILPTAEAFAPIRAMQQRMLLAAVFLSLLAGGLAWWATWWMLRRQLSPMLAATQTLATLSTTNRPPQPLPITSQDEIGELIGGFNRLLERLVRTNADLKRFAEVTAHHLQEPARRMGNYAERLTQQLGGRLDDAEARQSLEFIGQQAHRQQNLLRDVERYLAADQPRGGVKNLDVGKIVAGMLARMTARIGEAGAKIELGNLPAARIDAPRLEDVFAVALDNALNHGRSDHPLHIMIDGERRGSQVRYSISDNGAGVEEQYREQVFGVFERLSSNHEGTGIGLAILRRIVESCDGRAWIEESTGGGCRLLFELPLGETGEPR